jgi:hypothetical protein
LRTASGRGGAIEYSTVTGTVGIALRLMRPSRSRLLRVYESIFCDILNQPANPVELHRFDERTGKFRLGRDQFLTNAPLHSNGIFCRQIA